MRKAVIGVLILWLATMAFAQQSQAPAAKPAAKPPDPMKLKVGATAPDFTLLAYDGAKVTPVSLHDYKGKKNVALAFYVFAFTGG